MPVSNAAFDDGFHVRNLRLQLGQKIEKTVMAFPWGEIGDLQEAEGRGIVFGYGLRNGHGFQIEAVWNDVKAVFRQKRPPFFRHQR